MRESYRDSLFFCAFDEDRLRRYAICDCIDDSDGQNDFRDIRMKMKEKRDKQLHYHVYVVLLDESVARMPQVKKLNPEHDPDKPCVYVGMTGLKPEKRLEKHRAGYKASRFVKQYGIRLLPGLYAELNPLTYDEAVIAEAGLARRLRAEGYSVVGGH